MGTSNSSLGQGRSRRRIGNLRHRYARDAVRATAVRAGLVDPLGQELRARTSHVGWHLGQLLMELPRSPWSTVHTVAASCVRAGVEGSVERCVRQLRAAGWVHLPTIGAQAHRPPPKVALDPDQRGLLQAYAQVWLPYPGAPRASGFSLARSAVATACLDLLDTDRRIVTTREVREKTARAGAEHGWSLCPRRVREAIALLRDRRVLCLLSPRPASPGVPGVALTDLGRRALAWVEFTSTGIRRRPRTARVQDDQHEVMCARVLESIWAYLPGMDGWRAGRATPLPRGSVPWPTPASGLCRPDLSVPARDHGGRDIAVYVEVERRGIRDHLWQHIINHAALSCLPNPEGGRPFPHVLIIVYENITESRRTTIMEALAATERIRASMGAEFHIEASSCERVGHVFAELRLENRVERQPRVPRIDHRG